MLKVKDNVDSKELEKYGFEKNTFDMSLKIEKFDHSIEINISLDDGIIFIKNDYYDCDYEVEIPNILYDLIKADLIEKVDDK